jgi:hypothetical protein
MKIRTLSQYLAKNQLSAEEIEAILTDAIEPLLATKRSQGYLEHIRHSKRHREARTCRCNKEFNDYLDMLSDLTHE